MAKFLKSWQKFWKVGQNSEWLMKILKSWWKFWKVGILALLYYCILSFLHYSLLELLHCCIVALLHSYIAFNSCILKLHCILALHCINILKKASSLKNFRMVSLSLPLYISLSLKVAYLTNKDHDSSSKFVWQLVPAPDDARQSPGSF